MNLAGLRVALAHVSAVALALAAGTLAGIGLLDLIARALTGT